MTKSQTIDILIPTRRDTLGVRRVVEESRLLTTRHSIRIIVSVSDPTAFETIRCELSNDAEGVELLPPAGALTLYGNFRRLVKAATSEWLMICADDDARAPGLLDHCLEVSDADCAMVVPPIEARPFDREVHAFGNKTGEIAATATRGGRLRQTENAHPGWVFSLWRTEWIQANFPEEDFDWLDCALVQGAVYSGRARYASTAPPITCGYVPGRRPWAVASSGLHDTSGWERYCKETFVDESAAARLTWRLGPTRRYRRLARRLNRSATTTGGEDR